MKEEKLQIKKLDERAIIPTYGTVDSAGADLYALLDSDLEIKPKEMQMISTGLSMAIPTSKAIMLFVADMIWVQSSFS